VKCWPTTLAILTVLLASLGLAEDFKTINGKIYKDTTISRVEADGIVLKTKTGISKVYFVELPKTFGNGFSPLLRRPSRRSANASRSSQPGEKQRWQIRLLS
jgi:hypothetical protein